MTEERITQIEKYIKDAKGGYWCSDIFQGAKELIEEVRRLEAEGCPDCDTEYNNPFGRPCELCKQFAWYDTGTPSAESCSETGCNICSDCLKDEPVCPRCEK